MRLILTLHDRQRAQGFSHFLNEEGLTNTMEVVERATGEMLFQIWIMDEDQLQKALRLSSEFQKNPEDPKFLDYPSKSAPKPPPIPKALRRQDNGPNVKFRKRPNMRRNSSMGSITAAILTLCLILYTWSQISVLPPAESTQTDKPTARQLATNPVWKQLLIDYPEKLSLLDQLYNTYGVKWIEKPGSLAPEGKVLLLKHSRTPQWSGIYAEILRQRRLDVKITAPLFERVKQGEVWRLVTPAFLHGHFWHILFNMLWLLILGGQVENRLGWKRYIAFILIAAAIPNIAQYLMGGYNFVGYSGVVCAMIGFIWMRQKIAAWEGYLLAPNTVLLVSVFVLGLTLLQCYSFYLEWTVGKGLPAVMANTAHIVGGLTGIVLGRLPVFAWRQGR